MKRKVQPAGPVVGEIYSDWQYRQVLRARDPNWLRARAAACRAIIDGQPPAREFAGHYLHLHPYPWLESEAKKCTDRAAAIEVGAVVPDLYVATKGKATDVS